MTSCFYVFRFPHLFIALATELDLPLLRDDPALWDPDVDALPLLHDARVGLGVGGAGDVKGGEANTLAVVKRLG